MFMYAPFKHLGQATSLRLASRPSPARFRQQISRSICLQKPPNAVRHLLRRRRTISAKTPPSSNNAAGSGTSGITGAKINPLFLYTPSSTSYLPQPTIHPASLISRASYKVQRGSSMRSFKSWIYPLPLHKNACGPVPSESVDDVPTVNRRLTNKASCPFPKPQLAEELGSAVDAAFETLAMRRAETQGERRALHPPLLDPPVPAVYTLPYGKFKFPALFQCPTSPNAGARS